MTEPVKHLVTLQFADETTKRFPADAKVTVVKQVEVVLAADYARLEQECAELRAESPEWSAMQQRLGNENQRLRESLYEFEYGDLFHALAERDAALKLLAKCQEKLDPHRDAVLWGEVCDVLKRQ